MSGFRKPQLGRDELYLFPPTVEEFVGPMARVRSFDEILSHARFRKVFDGWAERYVLVEGRPPYHPRHLAALYFYGAMEGILSSRKLEAACRTRIDVKWLMEGLTPDHSTIAAFLKVHADALDQLFKEVLVVASEMGLLKLQHVAVDGTKLEANASGSSVKSQGEIEKLLQACEEEVKRLREQWLENEACDQRLFDDEEDEPLKEPARLRRAEARRQKMNATLEAIAKRRNEASRPKDASDRGSVTDRDSRFMKDKKGRFAPGYNVQIAVDAEAGIIAATEVNDQADDSGLLGRMVDEVAENSGSLPEKVSADTAYNVGHDLQALEKAGVVVYVPEQSNGKARTTKSKEALEALKRGEMLTEEQWKVVPRGRNGKLGRNAFEYDEEQDVYRCPRGEVLSPFGISKDSHRYGVSRRTRYRVKKGACSECPFAKHCCSDPKRGRTLSRDGFEDSRKQVRERMATEEGRETYAQRAPLAETPSGFLKANLGISRFLRRGFDGVRAENHVIWIAYNLRIMVKHALRLAAACERKAPRLALDSG